MPALTPGKLDIKSDYKTFKQATGTMIKSDEAQTHKHTYSKNG